MLEEFEIDKNNIVPESIEGRKTTEELEKQKLRFEFEKVAQDRAAISDGQKLLALVQSKEYSAPEDYIQKELKEARERDNHMVTSLDMVNLYKWHLAAALERRPFAVEKYKDLLERVARGFSWAIDRYSIGPIADLGYDLERYRDRLIRAETSSELMQTIDDVVHAGHTAGPIARMLIRDLKDLTPRQTKDFFDKLSTLY